MNDILIPDITESNDSVPSTESVPCASDEITESVIPDENEDITEKLNQRIAELNEELEAYKNAAAKQEAITKQLSEFSELFPDISVKAIPDEVWEEVKIGNSLAAAYSLYERRITEAARRIERINAQNAERAAGAAGKNMTQEFFSVDDVRKMSPSEVRANYAKIRRSMEKWN